MEHERPIRTWGLRAMVLVAAWLLFEVSCAVALLGLRYAGRVVYQPISARTLSAEHRHALRTLLEGRTTYTAYDETLGWTIKPNGASPPLYRANGGGLRGDRDYGPRPSGATVRMAAFGDSFTHGDDVANEDTWEEAMARAVRDLEVLNFGVGGFGLDQAYLRWRREGPAYHPSLVLIGFMSENIHRTVNVFRPFYSPATRQPLSKPRFRLVDDRLDLLANPIRTLADYEDLLAEPAPVLRRLGAHDHFFQVESWASAWDVIPSVRLAKVARHQWRDRQDPIVWNGTYTPSSEAFAVTARLFDAFVADVERAGARPVILLFPSRDDLARYRRDRTRSYAPLLVHLEARGHAYIDLMDAFDACSGDCDLDALAPSHYSPRGNQLVARHILRHLGLVQGDAAIAGHAPHP